MTEKDDTAILLRAIKQDLRGMMNGPVSTSMREKGLAYKVNFGVETPRLQVYSNSLPHTYALAAALWKEDIRECRLLAGMLMPSESFDSELAEIWVEQMRFTEEAEHTVMNLFCHTSWASTKAFEWIATSDDIHQICGYLLFCRLFMRGMMPSARDAQEFADQAHSALASTSPAVRRAAAKALIKYEELYNDAATE